MHGTVSMTDYEFPDCDNLTVWQLWAKDTNNNTFIPYFTKNKITIIG